MLEDYYGHTSNVTMSDELTKTKTRTPSPKLTIKRTKGIDPTFGWLGQSKNPSETGNDETPTEPTYVDLISE